MKRYLSQIVHRDRAVVIQIAKEPLGAGLSEVGDDVEIVGRCHRTVQVGIAEACVLHQHIAESGREGAAGEAAQLQQRVVNHAQGSRTRR